MKAVAVCQTENGSSLELIDIEKPAPSEHQALVEVKASGLNRTDLRRAQQHFSNTGTRHIAGLELAGIVVAIGDSVTDLEVGDRVMAMAPNAYAEYALVDARTAIKVPEGVDWPEASSIPTWYQTAHNALVGEGGFAAGQSVLITAASSGIGIASVQIAKLLGAKKIIGTSSSAKKFPALRDIGLDVGIIPSQENLSERVLAETDGEGVDVVIDMIGGGLLSDLLDATKNGGTIVSVGRMGGFTDEIDLDKLALKRLRLVGVTFRSLDLNGKRALRDAMLRDLHAALSEGRLKPLVDRTFPLDQALAAQEYMSENKHFGKVVLIP
ncbi:quinone oxidoreductase family protein [Hoeflea sp.]|uniref:quinone oxidoreductase family protein n=1 Tax=Hoeflea sp. TaxID=1940281 RepID=UPI003B02652F